MKNTYVPCGACGKLNRVNLEAASSREPICGGCKATLPLHFGVAEVNEKGLSTLVAKNELPVVCDFWAPWCGPCKSFAPVFQQAALRFAGKIVFAKLNTEQYPQAGNTHGIKGIPAIVLFSKGREIARLAGAVPADHLSEWLIQHAEK